MHFNFNPVVVYCHNLTAWAVCMHLGQYVTVVKLVSPNVVTTVPSRWNPKSEICFRPLIDGSVYTSGTGHIISVTACREPDVQEERT